MRKLIIVGEAPSQRGAPEKPIEGRIGRRLANLADLEFGDFLARTERRNLLNAWPGSSGKGSAFPPRAARRAALRMIEGFMVDDRVILLGRRVATAFGVRRNYLEWCHDIDFVNVAVFPHPSGINRWFNSPRNSWYARAFLRQAFEEQL